MLFADTQTASTFFAPALPSDAKAFASYWQVGTNDTVLVGGPALVRNASLSGARLSIRGDLNASTPLTLVVPTAVESVEWNGKNVDVKATHEFAGVKILAGQLSFGLDKGSITVPSLSGWKFQDSLPEVQSTFDDGNWTVADHTSTNITTKPVFGDGRVLYGASHCVIVNGRVEDLMLCAGCDYGFCENIVLWRGHFNATGAETSVNLTINGGNGKRLCASTRCRCCTHHVVL